SKFRVKAHPYLAVAVISREYECNGRVQPHATWSVFVDPAAASSWTGHEVEEDKLVSVIFATPFTLRSPGYQGRKRSESPEWAIIA
ncbi:MAG TPA: hypothetical protein VGP38_08910, partial [Rubrobacter sp.]|nr:hypothetical protein [Rubrobacter sp.]